jgi:hypothetical protein
VSDRTPRLDPSSCWPTTQLGVPVASDLPLSLGVEHAPAVWGAPPRCMGTVGVWQKVTLPIPFLRDGGAGR